ncbi:MAG: hypothetical protein PQJ58_19390 [Spirochaetales bacterium]|nr:hypothetical protein [Spirochaetales bacterium]
MNHESICKTALMILEPAIKKLLAEKAKREDMHIVIMNPLLHPWDCSFEEAILLEHSTTDKSNWQIPFDEFALAKAKQAWRDGRSNKEKHLMAPATLQDGDIAFYGSFEHNGVIVAASGVEPWYDVMVSGWIAVAIQQFAQAEYEQFKSENPMKPYID